MNEYRLSIVICAAFGVFMTAQSFAQRNEMPPGYPQSLEGDLRRLLAEQQESGASPEFLVRLAETYFDLADDLLTEKTKRLAAYEAGASAAKQAFEINDANADAHFFHAVNLGSAARLSGVTNAAMTVGTIKHCAQRAIEINPRHAQALQMMGGLLMEIPWFLGGSERKAQDFLERSISVDSNFANAHIMLAKLYLKQGRREAAKTQLETVVRLERPHYRYTWERKYKPEAERLLKELSSS
ncbi:MAG: tetratricopeptide repeat protein [Nitrospira sp. CR1.3]|nr:tetratricopeptide repeat protein [Nitrospira sp. CR1.3]